MLAQIFCAGNMLELIDYIACTLSPSLLADNALVGAGQTETALTFPTSESVDKFWNSSIRIGSDWITGICYLVIPLLMLIFARKKRDIFFPKAFGLFTAYLLICGATEFTDTFQVGWDNPWLETALYLARAIMSVVTVCVLIAILPQALKLRGPEQSQREIDARAQQVVQLTDRIVDDSRQMEEASQTLEENRELLRLAMEYGNTGFFSWDLESNLITFDEAGARQIGLLNGQLCMALDDFVQNINPEYRAETEAAGRRTLEELHEFNVRYPYRLPDGREVWISGRGRAFVDNYCKVKKIVGLHQDVTEQVEREKELGQQTEKARRANDFKTKFIAQVSHEIRTPLAAMLGGLDTMLMSNEINDCREVLSVVRSQGELLQVLVNDVLDLSKIETGVINYDAKPTLVANVISDVWSVMNPLANEKGVTIEWIAETKLPEKIICDHLRLKQIFVNLISNAIKFTDQGAVTVVCRVDCDEIDHHFLVVEVRDSAIDSKNDDGEDSINSAFGEFGKVNQFRSGYGLGLTICKRLVEIMGGDISAKSREGGGYTFVVRIPIGNISEEELVVLDSISISIKRHPKTQVEEIQLPLKVLAAEDTRAIQFVLRRMIGSMVSDFTIANNGRIACEEVLKAEQSDAPFDLVLMDVQMPELDGVEATKKLRSQGYTRPIIALTAGAMDSEKQACLEAGCTHFLSKPIDLRELKRLMKQISQDKLGNT